MSLDEAVRMGRASPNYMAKTSTSFSNYNSNENRGHEPNNGTLNNKKVSITKVKEVVSETTIQKQTNHSSSEGYEHESVIKVIQRQIANQSQGDIVLLGDGNPTKKMSSASQDHRNADVRSALSTGKGFKNKSASIINMEFSSAKRVPVCKDPSNSHNYEHSNYNINNAPMRKRPVLMPDSFSQHVDRAKSQDSESHQMPQVILTINNKNQDWFSGNFNSNPNSQPPTIVYDFKDLERIRYFRDNRLVFRHDHRGSVGSQNSSNKVQLSPLKKLSTQLANYINKQYLNIQKLKPVFKKKGSDVQNYSVQDEEISKDNREAVPPRNSETSPEKYRSRHFYPAYHHRRGKGAYKERDEEQYRTTYVNPVQNQEMSLQDRMDKVVSSQDKRQKGAPIICQEFVFTRKGFNRKDYFVFGLGDRTTPADKIENYRDFLWKINMSNSLFIEPEVELQKNYKIYIGRGNNSMLIRGLMKRRFWWSIVDKINVDEVHFVWTQLKVNQIFKVQKNKKLQPALPYSSHQAQKTSQTKTSTSTQNNSDSEPSRHSKTPSCSTQPSTLLNSQPPSKTNLLARDDYNANIFSQQDLQMWQSHYSKNKKIEETISDKTYNKRSLLLKQKNAVKIQNVDSLRVHNHFNSNFFIGNKKAMFYCMRKYYELNGMNVFDYLPLTFHISKGTEDPEYKKFIHHHKLFQEQRQTDKSIRNIWIVKPGEFTNRGTGITVCSSLDDIHIRLKSRERCSNGKLRTFIVQKYLEKPLLYNRRKFDIRHYMMITCINGQFKGYWYQEGYIRTTSYEYNVKNCKDTLIHLTNDAIQKNTDDYGKFEKGNKLSYADFQKYLDQKHPGYDFYGTILPQMKKICTESIRASYFLLDPDRKQHNFEIFGMDFMIDEDFKPWLIEINTNPCLELSCPLLSNIIPAMVDNALKIGLDPLFQPPYNWPSNKKYQLGDTPLQSNKFCIVFDEMVDGEAIQHLYQNVQRVDKNMGEIEEQDEEYDDQGKEWNEDE